MADGLRWRIGSPRQIQGTAGSAINNFTLNAATDQLEGIFAADDAITITRVGIRQTTLTGVAPVFRVSLQGVTNQVPDGTIKNSGNAYFDYTPTAGNNNTFQWLTLGATYAVARGEPFSIVIAYQSGTIDGSNNCSFGTVPNGPQSIGFPYAITNDAGSRTPTTGYPMMGYGSSTRAYGGPLQNATTLNVNTGTTPDEVGFKFTIPSTWFSTFKVMGVYVHQTMPAARVNKLRLYDSDGSTVLHEVDRDTDTSVITGNRPNEIIFDDATLATLNTGTAYYATLTPQDGTSQTHQFFDVAAEADWDAYEGGRQFPWVQRTDAGAWTTTVTRRILMDLILTDITGGGSGGIFSPLRGPF